MRIVSADRAVAKGRPGDKVLPYLAYRTYCLYRVLMVTHKTTKDTAHVASYLTTTGLAISSPLTREGVNELETIVVQVRGRIHSVRLERGFNKRAFANPEDRAALHKITLKKFGHATRVVWKGEEPAEQGLFKAALTKLLTVNFLTVDRVRPAVDQFFLACRGVTLLEIQVPTDQKALSLVELRSKGRERIGAAEAARLDHLTRTRKEIEANVSFLSAEVVAKARGSTASGFRSFAQRLRKEGALAYKRGKGFVYPAFQFSGDGRVAPHMAPILEAINAGRQNEGADSGWATMQWFVTRSGLLAGERPIDVFTREPDAVVCAAKARFSREHGS